MGTNKLRKVAYNIRCITFPYAFSYAAEALSWVPVDRLDNAARTALAVDFPLREWTVSRVIDIHGTG